ncbi:MAG: ROK family protein [Reichenbachiella sp.]
MPEITIGIDIGGTSTKFGIVDAEANVIYQNSVDTQLPDVNDYLRGLVAAINVGLNELDVDYNLLGIGIGAPNANYFRGTIEEAPNLPWKGVVPIAKLLQSEFHVPVAVTNDANAAAIGEMVYGGAQEMKDFIVITLGTGLGSGLVANGEMILGNDGFAGEIGHVAVKINGGRKCKCGLRGCLETYVSATGLKRTVYKLLADHHVDSELRKYSFEDLDTKIVGIAAENGDSLAQEAFDYTGKVLGAKLADSVKHTDPEAIFIMGGLAQAGELIFAPTRKHLEKNLMEIYKGKVKILPSELDNQTAPIVGASSLIIDRLNKDASKGELV